MMKTYTVEGIIKLKNSQKSFVKDFNGTKEEDVIDEIYKKFGSVYGCKRKNIEIKSITEKREDV